MTFTTFSSGFLSGDDVCLMYSDKQRVTIPNEAMQNANITAGGRETTKFFMF